MVMVYVVVCCAWAWIRPLECVQTSEFSQIGSIGTSFLCIVMDNLMAARDEMPLKIIATDILCVDFKRGKI